MFTFKFAGLSEQDSLTPYYYGSLPAKPERGQILVFESGNRYTIQQIVGEGLTGRSARADQETLAWKELIDEERVPTIFLREIPSWRITGAVHRKDAVGETTVTGQSFTAEELKERSKHNRKQRHERPKKSKRPKRPKR